MPIHLFWICKVTPVGRVRVVADGVRRGQQAAGDWLASLEEPGRRIEKKKPLLLSEIFVKRINIFLPRLLGLTSAVTEKMSK